MVTNMPGYGYLYQKIKINEGFCPKPHILAIMSVRLDADINKISVLSVQIFQITISLDTVVSHVMTLSTRTIAVVVQLLLTVLVVKVAMMTKSSFTSGKS